METIVNIVEHFQDVQQDSGPESEVSVDSLIEGRLLVFFYDK